MLKSFEIHGFRTFAQLRVERLGRINLVVGKNNVGKTMFLEALRLYASGCSPVVIRNLLLDREEVAIEPIDMDVEEEFSLRIGTLFHLRKNVQSRVREIQLGPIGDASRKWKIFWQRATHSENGYSDDESNALNEIRITRNELPEKKYTFKQLSYRRLPSSADLMKRPAFITPSGVTDREIARWWDLVVLRNAEQRVIDCLRLIVPVERVTLIEYPDSKRRGDRLVLIKIEGDPIPIQLKSLGDGMTRIFQLALALEYSLGLRFDRWDAERQMYTASQEDDHEKYMLLIDEIDNGIHYTVLRNLWKFVIQLAKSHNVQVFATTHSWDCVRGLQEATADLPDADAMLIRLEKQPQTTKAITFDQSELAIVARDEIEVR